MCSGPSSQDSSDGLSQPPSTCLYRSETGTSHSVGFVFVFTVPRHGQVFSLKLQILDRASVEF